MFFFTSLVVCSWNKIVSTVQLFLEGKGLITKLICFLFSFLFSSIFLPLDEFKARLDICERNVSVEVPVLSHLIQLCKFSDLREHLWKGRF